MTFARSFCGGMSLVGMVRRRVLHADMYCSYPCSIVVVIGQISFLNSSRGTLYRMVTRDSSVYLPVPRRNASTALSFGCAPTSLLSSGLSRSAQPHVVDDVVLQSRLVVRVVYPTGNAH